MHRVVSACSRSTAAGVPKATSSLLCMIAAGDNASYCARYRVPDGNTCYVTSINTGSGLQDGNTTWNLWKKTDTGPKILLKKYIQNRAACEKQHNEIPIKLKAGEEIWVDATGAASASACMIELEMVRVHQAE